MTRADPSEDELVFSARGICSNKENDPVRGKLSQFFRPFAKAYINICQKQKRVFFGLRDFYRSDISIVVLCMYDRYSSVHACVCVCVYTV